jgi:hypothetical protein
MQKTDYRNVFAVSQSAIKAFKTKSLQKFKQIYIDKEEDDDDDQDKFAFGSLVDTLAFEPNLIDERFYIPDSEVEIPGDKIKIIVDKTYKEASEIVANKTILNAQGNLPEPLYVPNLIDLYDWQDIILKYAREIKYGGTTWSNTRILDNVYNDAYGYFRMLGTAGGRSIITSRDNGDAIEMVDALRKSKDTQKYFVADENTTLLFQQEIFVNYHYPNGMIVPLKGALDIIYLNHLNEEAQVPDLKTSFNTEGFKTQARSFDYVTQAAFYNFLIREWLKTYMNGKYAHYKILPPLNIVIDRTFKVPYIYEYDWLDIEIATDGSDTNNVTGWKNILNEIAWHIETGVWDRPRELHETGKIKLKIFNK